MMQNESIYRALEMTSNALTTGGKQVTSNIACVRSQQYTQYSVFRLAQTMMCANFPSFCRNKCHFRWMDKQDVDASNVRFPVSLTLDVQEDLGLGASLCPPACYEADQVNILLLRSVVSTVDRTQLHAEQTYIHMQQYITER